eukprot:jgi/Mesvir1/17311/Mv07707-RA.2
MNRRLLSNYYKLGAVLGTGGFSTVRVATNRKTGEKVAVKTLNKKGKYSGDDSLIRNEIAVMVRILEKVSSHPNVIRLLDVFDDAQDVSNFGLWSSCTFAAFSKDSISRNYVSAFSSASVEQFKFASFCRELDAEALRISGNGNVVSLGITIMFFEKNLQVHLVMELCTGGELFDRIVERGHYSEKASSQIISQIAKGLASLHAANVLHRDMKPENILFLTKDEDSPLKIMDFGLSHISGQTDPLAGLFGSLDYIAPEALESRTFLAAGDIWSLGVILYILLCGYPPFYAKTNRGKQEMIVQAKYDFDDPVWDTVSDSAKSLVKQMIVLDPSKRLTAEQVVNHPWVRGETAGGSLRNPAVFDRIVRFNARRKFRGAAWACVIGSQRMIRSSLKSLVGENRLDPEVFVRAQQLFLERSQDGQSVTLEQFTAVIHELGILQPDASAMVPRVFDVFDTNSDGSVDFREFICGLSTMRVPHSEDALKLCFDVSQGPTL